ncbi:MAG: transposase, partial [Deltaproteobacteria bacterium]|nr:transposase [Deltaproteobacteria bacterium]
TLIHHSDRGVQYCSTDYTALLIANGISISMAEQGNPYENAHAERVNGILKDEFHLDATFELPKFALKATAQTIGVYNDIRPHWSLKMRTPTAVYFEKNKQDFSRDFCPLQGANLGSCQVKYMYRFGDLLTFVYLSTFFRTMQTK